MPEPIGLSLAALVQLGKKDGPKVAVAAYRRVARKDWASTLAGKSLKGQQRPRPRLALRRTLHKDGLDELLTAAVVEEAGEPGAQLIEAVDRGLRRDLRWRRLADDVRHARSEVLAERLIEYFIASLDPSSAVSVVNDALSGRFDAVDQRLGEQRDRDSALVATLDAGQARGQLAVLKERLAALPASVRPWLESCFARDAQGVGQVVTAVSSGGLAPGRAAGEWISSGPSWLGTPDAPVRADCWSALGAVALVYEELESASRAFEYAARAGALPRDRFLAYAVWAALQAGDIPRARSVLPPGGGTDSRDPVMALVAMRCALLAEGDDPLEGTEQEGPRTAGTVPWPDAAAVIDRSRTLLGLWDPHDPLDRDLRARLGADLEFSDARCDQNAQFRTVVDLLEACLAREWVDTVALALGMVLHQRAAFGATLDRSGDLERAMQLALRVRQERRQTGQDSRRATEIAVNAAGLGQRFRRVIEIGSHRFGEAHEDEAAVPIVIRAVAQAAALGAPEIAAQLEETVDQVPAGFTRAWVRAALLCRKQRIPQLPRQEHIRLWQQVVNEAVGEEELRLALTGLSGVGGDGIPAEQLAQLAPWESLKSEPVRR